MTIKQKKIIAIIGAQGLVGSELTKVINAKTNLTCVEVVRGDNFAVKLQNVDYVIHAANSPKRYEAELNQQMDYEESVVKTAKLIDACKGAGARLLLISSISARTQLNTVYGRHRHACELMVLQAGCVVVRLGYMFSKQKIYGALSNIVNNEDVFLDPTSEYSYSDVSWNANKIVELLLTEGRGVVELGANGSITLQVIADLTSSTSVFKSDTIDIQIAQCDIKDRPKIQEFQDYLIGISANDKEIISKG
jgi:dTDP-4-dehydrorhamnose reductase